MYETIVLTTQDNMQREYEIVDIFTNNNRNYVAIIERAKTNAAQIELMKIQVTTQNEEEGYEITPIKSDMEYADVVHKFTERIMQG